MSNAFRTAPPPAALPESSSDDATDPRVARAEERLAMLRELAELGMALTRELTRRTLESPEAPEGGPAADANPKGAPRTIPGPRHDPAESFARLSRAVRLTLALEAKAEEELSALITGVKDRAAASPPAANDGGFPSGRLPRDYPSAHRNKVRDAIFDVINREVTDIYPAQETLDLLYERLIEGERYDAFVHRPLKEAVAAICDDLGLHPDWSRWTDDGFPPRPTGESGYDWQDCWGPTRARVEKLRELDRQQAAGAPAAGGPRLE
ncbi:MAG TPA: hypothetical protein VG248_16640 [Caulobacteraceae bacterium]|jgi:hypothetical protein|nr:hypothetical protein [Caulobacteraceae bacterium]